MNTETETKIEIRELPKDEWDRIADLESHCPSPEIARCFVAEKDGEIIGYWFLQLALCCEPVWIHPEHRSRQVAVKLYSKLTQSLKESKVHNFIVHTQDDQTAEYARRLGMIEAGFKTFVGHIE